MSMVRITESTLSAYADNVERLKHRISLDGYAIVESTTHTKNVLHMIAADENNENIKQYIKSNISNANI